MKFQRGDLVRCSFQQVLDNREDTEVHIVLAAHDVIAPGDEPFDGFTVLCTVEVVDTMGTVRHFDAALLSRVETQ
jgi:hypothetical protein